ncbi:hypothetical protein NDU88_001664 [Pleurodeles waltl]|uniref:Uncharacterized protein n=1 Tax=Pleurodeles waltl TaxID=8319 RepID=A0AAV7TIW6_PLEWA|nr:hypothetical protein NDU88_001664 [Pleurodeles waltl]
MRLTCADSAGAAPEHPDATTNELRASGASREGGGLKQAASAEEEEEENSARENWRKEGRDSERTEEEETLQGERIWMSGERYLLNRGGEINIAADGGLNAAVAQEDGAQEPATLLEKRGTSRCVGKLP